MDLHHNYQSEAGNGDDGGYLEETEDRLRAAEVLRRRMFPALDREVAVGIAHSVVSHWNTATLETFCREAGIR